MNPGQDLSIHAETRFVNLKSNLALLYKKGHNLLFYEIETFMMLHKYSQMEYVGQNKVLQRNKNYCPS